MQAGFIIIITIINIFLPPSQFWYTCSYMIFFPAAR